MRGLYASEGGMTLALDRNELARGAPTDLRFRIVDPNGRPVRDFEVEHEKRMHFIVVRRDLTAFQHLHPQMATDGTWRTPLTLPQSGSYRVFADFKSGGRNRTLAADVGVDGPVDRQRLPRAGESARTDSGYDVLMKGTGRTGRDATLRFTVTRAGRPVTVEPYLGAGGHLVALREGDLAYLHVHPGGHAEGAGGQHDEVDAVAFSTEFPSDGRYRLFLQFKHAGRVHTAAFTREVRGDPRPAPAEEQPEESHHG